MEEKKNIPNNSVYTAVYKNGKVIYEYIPLKDIKINDKQTLQDYFNEKDVIINKLINNNNQLAKAVADLTIKLNALSSSTKDSFDIVMDEMKKNEFL